MKGNMLRLRHLILVAASACVLVGVLAAPGVAAEGTLGPKFRIFAPTPNFMRKGQTSEFNIYVENIGDQTANGKIHLTDVLGSGLNFAGEVGYGGGTSDQASPPASCEVSQATMHCSLPGPLGPGAVWYVPVPVRVMAEAGTFTDALEATGGGTVGTARSESSVTVGSPGPFDFTETAAELLNADDSETVQAASVPSEFTTTLSFTSFEPEFAGILSFLGSAEHFKDVTVHLPVGFVGNPTIVPQCTVAQLATAGVYASGKRKLVSCPLDSQVGIAQVTLKGNSVPAELYNMVPPPGTATELGFNVLDTVVLLDAYVRPGDSGIDIVSRDTETTIPVTGVKVTVWGVPADPSHDKYRGECIDQEGYGSQDLSGCGTDAPLRSYLRMPTSCPGSPLQYGASTNTYEHPGVFAEASFTSGATIGCERVPFAPEIDVFPTGTAANSPTGVSVRVSQPQNSNPDGLGEADLKKAVVTLPEGMAINPSAADGLQACTDAELKQGVEGPSECPEASKIGTVLLHTPLLETPIEGNIYLLTQGSSDPESGEMYRIAIELRDDKNGIDIKIKGAISANKTTGRLTTTFDNNPQLPFSDITLSFKSGARAPLVTPASCQTQTTEAQLYSWAEPDVPVQRSNSFNLTSGAEGTSCPAPSPFNPGFNAGVSSVQAGGFTNFLTTFSRKDSDQSMQGVSVKLPLGLSGSLSSVSLCGEAQANAGTCTSDSEIGTVTAGAGAGPTPFYVTGGKVFITGPYKGAPFGLSVVVPAKAGPFDLGTVVVRAKVEVDRETAQLTVTTDPLPQIVGGVPVNLRLVNVTIDRHNFVFNSTDCKPASIQGTVTGGEGAVANVSSRFQVTNCSALKFAPKFSVSTSGKTSRANGASLIAKLSYPSGQVTQANIAKVKVELPKQLPSRLTTLQKACTAAIFNANPAGCPAASRIGTASATTPILPVPLVGPVYFVSHGGEAFPNLVVVLQGYGVTINLVGDTFISKAGITSTTFNAVPDVPVGSFELKLPEGPNSALAANANLCNSNLTMPTEFTAQNGTQLKQSTPIEIEGCAGSISFTSHKIKGRTLTVSVYAPAAGKLTVRGSGLSSVSKTVKGRETLRLGLRQKRAGRLKTAVNATFTPNAGKDRRKQFKSMKLTFKK